MSSRALRKLQKEQELEKRLAAARELEEEPADEEDEDGESEIIPAPKNAFDMLNEEDIDEESDEDGSQSHTPAQPSEPSSTPSKSKPKKKKKKQKKKAKEKPEEPTETVDSGDEIDRALRELSAKGKRDDDEQLDIPWEASATKLLSIDQKSLDPINEMRGLFGNIALEGESRSQPRSQRRREVNLQGGVDLATALTGRYSMASRGKELGALAKRRNFFMQGKEEWPLATSGGLGMENLLNEGFEKRYDIIHNQQYRETQLQFRMAVESMQPDNMIGLLSRNPYHIASLLQVSEIARHQGDHSLAGDLLERALFTFGRSLHSSFPSAMRGGTARVSFNKPANRELYLTIWRYARNLEQRGTWRTAFEWAKLLLQLDTLSDPFGVTLMIDQLALRGRQHEQLIQLTSGNAYGNAWHHLPNIQISLALAYLKAQKPRDARRQLAIAMHHYPYVLSELASSLEVSPIPKAIWGKLPSTDAEKLYSQLYVTRAKDLWNTPETIGLISEVANTLPYYKEAIDQSSPAPKLEISLEEARHIMLLEIPALIALLPRVFTNMPTSSSDVLPPPDSQATDFLTARAPTDASGPSALQNIFNAAGAGAATTGSLLQRLLDIFSAPFNPNEPIGQGEIQHQNVLREVRERLGLEELSEEMMSDMLQMHLQANAEDLVDDNLGLTGTPGDWGYYDGQDENEDDDSDEMPELEDVPRHDQPPERRHENALDPVQADTQEQPVSRGPHAATVEAADDSDEDTPINRPSNNSGGPVLRRVDSEDEDDQIPHPPPAHTIFAPVPATESNRARGASPAQPPPGIAEMPADSIDTSDPQRIQRWLLSTGLSDLQSNPAQLSRYVEKLKVLHKNQQGWIISMVRQRVGKELGDRIAAAL